MDEEQGLLSQGTVLRYKKPTATDFIELEYPQGWQGFSSDQDKHETTTLKNKKYKTYTTGLIDPGDLTFPSLYEKSEYYALKALEGTVLDWEMEFPDNTGYKWSGKHAITRDDGNFNEVMKATLKCTPGTEIEDLEDLEDIDSKS